jgi:hypothetical protein
MAEKKAVSAVVALKDFFGMKPGETLQEFLAEIRALSPEEKHNLAMLACQELGYELKVETPVAE